eukprot:TRINITY_DN5443_c0_g3_i1.p1 TRINITY_DN5443_c0_g3~~TRINITY_DN5443_c0_g3_i1.p1  ORF type:complete len:132 (-),score=23.26 TRINITY_DN5443_c0_g3_i1:51-446(-)
MQKLQRDDPIMSPMPPVVPVPIPIPPVIQYPQSSTCMLLKNMFDPASEEAKEPTFEHDLREDVMEEVTKFGSVRHVCVEKLGPGFVYLKFTSLDGAERAFRALNGRWFGGKMIAVEFVPEPLYNAKFPMAR